MAVLLFGIFVVEINRKEPTLSILQAIFYCVMAAASSACAFPLYLCGYVIRDGGKPTELMKLESRLLKIKRKGQFRCKWNLICI